MKKLLFCLLCASCMWAPVVAAADVAAAAKAALEKVTPGTIAYRAENGWLYSKNELAHLAKGELAAGKVAAASACPKPQNANPLPALKAFNEELQALGVKLILLPVPPKAAAAPFAPLGRLEAMAYLKPFYAELRAAGLEVVDLSEFFPADGADRLYCRTDAHWGPAGMALAVQTLAKMIGARGDAAFTAAASPQPIAGDLAKSLSADKPETEEVSLQVVEGKTLDESSPILLIGDSHTLVFSTGGDMLAEKAGLAEQLAVACKTPIDRIGVKGSAATAVRVNLYRKAAQNPDWLKNKKIVIYCFSCREFTESPSGWVTVPVMKK
ncbi:MAG: hypothetical protein J6333_11555 [Planctomycetes bacterium]|nr:hypothetical protein [Planctomycetota bacterium]